ncbi:MAG: NAD(P)H-hydrate epimerase [Dehalococcoidia bacterium]
MTISQRMQFSAPSGERVPAVSVAEMREIDRIATEDTGPSPLQTLEIAGQQAALAAIDLLGPRWRDGRAIVLCGTGRTGATGVCAARHLANRGVRVQVVTVVPPQRADGALGEAFLALAEAPARVTRWDEAFDVAAADVVVDAILGCEPADEALPVQRGLILAARAAAAAGVPVLSLDVPSGLDADTGDAPGDPPGDAVRPTRTLTFGLPKRGLTRETAGELWLADLGIPPGVFARAGVAFAPFLGAAASVLLAYPGEAMPFRD